VFLRADEIEEGSFQIATLGDQLEQFQARLQNGVRQIGRGRFGLQVDLELTSALSRKRRRQGAVRSGA
jgi:hypothetical protein